ncbi:hypothetical protein B0T25DRAFT_540145, partial [Lasiosphaeria hispida]
MSILITAITPAPGLLFLSMALNSNQSLVAQRLLGLISQRIHHRNLTRTRRCLFRKLQEASLDTALESGKVNAD